MDRKWWTLIAVSVAIFMLLLDITVVNVALPDIQRSLHSSFSDLQWVVNAYALTLAAFLLTSGSVADLIGRRRVFVDRPGRVHRLLGRLRPLHHAADAEPRARRAGHWRSDDVRHLSGAARPGVPRHESAERPSACSARSPAPRSRSGRCSAGSSPPGIGWEWIFFVNVPIGVVAVFITLAARGRLARPERHGRGLGRPDDLLRVAVPARVRARAGQREGLGLDRDRLVSARRGRPAGRCS